MSRSRSGNSAEGEGDSMQSGHAMGRARNLLSRREMPYLIIFLYSFLLFWQTLGFNIISLDDDVMIVENRHYNSKLSNLPEAFKRDILFKQSGSYYRPLLNSAIILETQLSNRWINPYHLSNNILHGLVGCLIFTFFLQIGLRRDISMLSALIFASHPLLVSSVGWINAKNDLMLALFFLLSLIFMIRYKERGKTKDLVLHGLAYALALFSKEASLVFPLIYVIFFVWVLKERLLSRKLLYLAIPWFMFIALYLIMRSAVVRANPDSSFLLGNLVYNLASFPEIFKKIILPYDLSLLSFYKAQTIAIGSALMLIALAFLVRQWLQSRKAQDEHERRLTRLAILGLLIFTIILLPGMMTMVADGKFFDYLENRAYLPLAGILLMLAGMLEYYLGSGKFKKYILPAGAIIIATLSIIGFNYTRVFSSPMRFYQYSVVKSPQSAIAWNNKGRILSEEKRRYEEAIYCFDRALAIMPDNPKSWTNKGNAQFYQGKFDKAIESYEKAKSVRADFMEAWIREAVALAQTGRSRDAIGNLDHVLADHPNNVTALFTKGKILADDPKRLAEADACFDKCLEYQPEYADVWNAKGKLREEQKNSAEALNCYNRAVAIDPLNSSAWSNKGVLHSKNGDFAGALECLAKATAANPDDPTIWNNKGNPLVSLHRYDEAIECFDRAIKIKPDFADAYCNKGVALKAKGDISGALQCYDKAIELKSDYADPWTNKANALLAQEKYSDAIDCYDKSLKINPAQPDVLQNKGIALSVLNRYSEALDAFDKALELNPADPDGWQNKGLILKELGKTASADYCFAKAKELGTNLRK